MEKTAPNRDTASSKDRDPRKGQDELSSLQQKARKDFANKTGAVFTDWASI